MGVLEPANHKPEKRTFQAQARTQEKLNLEVKVTYSSIQSTENGE